MFARLQLPKFGKLSSSPHKFSRLSSSSLLQSTSIDAEELLYRGRPPLNWYEEKLALQDLAEREAQQSEQLSQRTESARNDIASPSSPA